jgi:hypothetical protein
MSFSVNNVINEINTKIIDISKKMGISIPNSSTISGFTNYNPVVYSSKRS